MEEGRTDSKLERLRAHMAVLVDFARLAPAAGDIQKLLDVACVQVSRATGVAHAKVLRYRSATADLLTVAGVGWKPGVVGWSVFNSDMASVAGRAFQTRLGVCINNLPEDPDYRYDPVLKEQSIVSLINSPINTDGNVWGVLELDSESADAFDSDDEQFLTAFAQILGSALRSHVAMEEQKHAAEEARQSVVEIQTLLDEQNHRVKNYFQIILSVISTRSTRSRNDEIKAEYREIMNRISAISLAHNLLTSRRGQTQAEVAEYLEALCSSIEKLYGAGLKISRSFEAVSVPQEGIVPLGLILNELLTNCFKYVKQPNAVAEILFESVPGTSEARLVVSDNGPGISGFRDGSQGLKLVQVLARQLSGQLGVQSTGAGTSVELTFPLI